MSTTSGKRSQRKRADEKPATPLKVSTNYGPANVQAKVEDPFATLTSPKSCRKNADCRMRMSPWSGLDRWVCDSCGFETFDAAEAKARLKT